LAVRLSQSIQFFHGALLNSASSNRCWLSWHCSGNGWSAPIAGYLTEEPKYHLCQFAFKSVHSFSK